jgi:hypothetical protein
MTESALLSDRVDRILDGLKQAGLSSVVHHRAVAIATLAGGATDTPARRGVGAIVARYPLPSLEAADLARVFPLDAVDVQNALPPVRPELIGDAFVRRLIEDSSEVDQSKMIETAWSANPEGSLRSALRLAGSADRLGELLREAPPRQFADQVAVAEAYAELSVWLPIGAKPESRDAETARRLAPTALKVCANLEPDEADRMFPALLDLASSRELARPFLTVAWFSIVGATLARATKKTPEQALVWIDHLFRIAFRLRGTSADLRISTSLQKGWPILHDADLWGAGEICRVADIYRTYRSHCVAQSMFGQFSESLARIESGPSKTQIRVFSA